MITTERGQVFTACLELAVIALTHCGIRCPQAAYMPAITEGVVIGRRQLRFEWIKYPDREDLVMLRQRSEMLFATRRGP